MNILFENFTLSIDDTPLDKAWIFWHDNYRRKLSFKAWIKTSYNLNIEWGQYDAILSGSHKDYLIFLLRFT